MPPSKITVRRMVGLNSDDVDWYERTYGEDRLSWVLAMLLQKFREAHQHTPEFYADLAAKTLKEEIEENLT